MPRRKNGQHNLSKILTRRVSLEDLPRKTIRVTIHALRWTFLLIFLFILAGIFALFLTGGESYIQLIVGYSIAGFFTFFMGYFGWILAQGIIEMITGKNKKPERGVSYYFRALKRHRF